jgi:hypothetical protein
MLSTFLFGTFFNITPDNISTMFSYTQALISDLTPLLLPIIGVGVGILVVWAVIRSFR